MNRLYLNGTDWKIKEFIGLDWVWRDSVKPQTGDTRWWYPAQVPGTVLDDLERAGQLKDPFYELNSKLCEWVPARSWVYRKEFEVPKDWRGRHVELCFQGIDYEGTIYLNGKKLGSHTGMYTPYQIDVTDRLLYGEQNLLAVVVEAAPYEQPQVGRTSLVHTHKSRMTYWWDFCPRMIHQGIWQDVYLEVTEDIRFTDVYVCSRLADDHTSAEIQIEIETAGAQEGIVRGSFGDVTFEEKVVCSHAAVTLTVEQPRLWWTNGEGEPFEYLVQLQLLSGRQHQVSDTRSLHYGIRDIRFLQNEGCNDPNGRFTLCLNGRVLYIKGYNWVPADVKYGTVKEKRIRHLVRLAREAGVNMFRVWGGGLIETDLFYRTCAENGILVWQEFIQSSSGIENKTPERKEYCEMMQREAEIILKSKRNHTALAVWCGGNELQDKHGNPLDNTDKLLAILKTQVETWDPGRKWLPTSPSGGLFLNSMENIQNAPDRLLDVHGPWEHQGMKKHCLLYNSGTSLMASEFGVEGMANQGTIERCVAKEHRLPANKDNEIYFHRGAWWNNEPLVQETFGGNLQTVDQIRRASQFMQYEGLKYSVECNLRRAMRNSASFPWQFNEPYPNLFCTSVVDYYGFPKPAYYGMKKAYGEYTVTAMFESPSMEGEKQFKTKLYAGIPEHADRFDGAVPKQNTEKRKAVIICVEILDMNGYSAHKERFHADVSGEIGMLCCDLDRIETALFVLRIKMSDGTQSLAENEYLFTKTADFGSLWQLEEPSLDIWQNEGEFIVKNIAGTAALFVWMTSDESRTEQHLYVEDNYVCLMPGETRKIRTQGEADSIRIEALNMSGQIIEWKG